MGTAQGIEIVVVVFGPKSDGFVGCWWCWDVYSGWLAGWLATGTWKDSIWLLDDFKMIKTAALVTT